MSPRSWVMRTIAASVCCCAALITSTICAWIVTSSAVVGSSAMRMLGLLAIAIAIIARWRIPPENSCGYWSTRRSANGTPTLFRSSIVARARRRLLHAVVVREDGLRDLVADREHGVQRRHRILEDHRHLAAAEVAKLLLRHRQEVLPLVQRLAGGDAAGRHRRQPEHGEHRHALARSGLADDAEHLAGIQVVADPGDRADDCRPRSRTRP